MGPPFFCSPNSKSSSKNKYSSHPPVTVQDRLTPLEGHGESSTPEWKRAEKEKIKHVLQRTGCMGCGIEGWQEKTQSHTSRLKAVLTMSSISAILNQVFLLEQQCAPTSSFLIPSGHPSSTTHSHFSSLFSPYFFLTPSSHQSSSLLTELPYQIAPKTCTYVTVELLPAGC